MCLLRKCDDLYEPRISIESIFYLVYDIDCIFSMTYFKKDMTTKSSLTTLIPHMSYEFESRSFIQAKSPNNSFYIFVCFNWNNAFDNWDILNRATFDTCS